MKKAPVAPVGLISAVPFESARLLKSLKDKAKISSGITRGSIGKDSVIHMTSGIGMANAAHAATVLIRDFSPCFILLFGIGGAYPGSGLKPGDVAVAEREIYADTGVITAEGFKGINETGWPLLRKGHKRYFNEYPLNRALLKKAGGIKSGVFLTVAQSTGTLKRAKELGEKYNALCENMEGAAVAQICALYGVPMVEFRGISNMVEDRDKTKWNITSASENCRKAVKEYLSRVS